MVGKLQKSKQSPDDKDRFAVWRHIFEFLFEKILQNVRKSSALENEGKRTISPTHWIDTRLARLLKKFELDDVQAYLTESI